MYTVWMIVKRLPFVVMVFCFVYAGVSLLLFSQQIVSGAYFNPSRLAFGERNASALQPGEPSGLDGVGLSALHSERLRRGEFRMRVIAYTAQAFTLSGAVISLLAGGCLLSLLYKKQQVDIEEDLLESLTTPEEKLVLQRLGQAQGELTQSELVKHTGLSRVKVHRILNRLEQLGIVKKFPFGMTNKIRLERRVNVQAKSRSSPNPPLGQ